jgi:CO/xanthine dehydrogenase FAD-binding subunit
MLKPFDLFMPDTLKEAFDLMEKHKDAKVVAGGSDVFVLMHKGEEHPCMIDIKNIKELQGFACSASLGMKIGALTKLCELERSDFVQKYYPALADAASKMASIQVRNKGTVGGNICNASPAADTAGPLYIYDATVEIVSRSGPRIVAITDFFTGPKKTCLKPGELVAQITLPAPTPNSGSAYQKLMKRGAMEIGIMSTGVKVAVDKDGICVLARISLSAVNPTPIRATVAEEYLVGKKLTAETIGHAAELAYGIACPLTWRNCEEWSKDMVLVFVPQALDHAIKRMQKGAF